MMHTRKYLTPFVAAFVVAASAVPAAASPVGQDLPVAQASAKKVQLTAVLDACTPDGYATFAGTMPASGPHSRMEMRFELQQRGIAGRGWTLLRDIPSFGVWDGADPGVPGFIVRKRVGGLQPGGVYRAVVKYRWRNPRGKVVRAAKRVTAPCMQPNTLADLQLRNPDVVRGTGDGLWTYRAFVVNTGASAAGPFDVALSLAGGAPVLQRVTELAPGARVLVEIRALRCEPGTAVQLGADSTNVVAESAEDNNVIERRCASR